LFPLSVDIGAKLDSILADNTLTTDYDFQMAISKAIVGLNDAHTQYDPSCYTQIPFVQPWSLAAVYNGSTTNIRFESTFAATSPIANVLGFAPEDMDAIWFPYLGTNASSLVGYIVTKIDGVDAVKAIQNFADVEQGLSRDAQTRFNIALQQYQWSVPQGSFKAKDQAALSPVDGKFYVRQRLLPTMNEMVNFELLSPVTGMKYNVQSPWIGFGGFRVRSSMSSSASFYNTFCNATAMSMAAGQQGQTTMPQMPPMPGGSQFIDSVKDVYAGPAIQSTKILEPVDFNAVNLELMGLAAGKKVGSKLADVNLDTPANLAQGANLSTPLFSDAQNAFYVLSNSTGVWVC
jgi:hypothetical protein